MVTPRLASRAVVTVGCCLPSRYRWIVVDQDYPSGPTFVNVMLNQSGRGGSQWPAARGLPLLRAARFPDDNEVLPGSNDQRSGYKRVS